VHAIQLQIGLDKAEHTLVDQPVLRVLSRPASRQVIENKDETAQVEAPRHGEPLSCASLRPAKLTETRLREFQVRRTARPRRSSSVRMAAWAGSVQWVRCSVSGLDVHLGTDGLQISGLVTDPMRSQLSLGMDDGRVYRIEITRGQSARQIAELVRACLQGQYRLNIEHEGETASQLHII